MKLVVGLGNPGSKYEDTRHNVGFKVVDSLWHLIAGKEDWKESRKFKALIFGPTASGTLLAKPQTFMNDSGVAVARLSAFYKILPDDIYVIHDDLDIRLGEYKIQLGIGPKVHNGVNSIEEKLGTHDFWRVRVGVDKRRPENRIPGEDYVLQKFEKEERTQLEQAVNQINSYITNNVLRS